MIAQNATNFYKELILGPERYLQVSHVSELRHVNSQPNPDIATNAADLEKCDTKLFFEHIQREISYVKPL